jgi:hypothetical protein
MAARLEPRDSFALLRERTRASLKAVDMMPSNGDSDARAGGGGMQDFLDHGLHSWKTRPYRDPPASATLPGGG